MKKLCDFSLAIVFLVSVLCASPIALAQPEALPEPTWTEGHYFPRFPEPDTVYVFSVPNAMVDWWGAPTSLGWRISDSSETMDALTLVGMQGVINRYHSCIYLDWEEAEVFDDRDGFWLPYISEHVEVVEMPQQGVDAVSYLMEHYGDLFSGAVVYDPEVPDTINVATMIAGLENRVIVSRQQLADPAFPGFSSVVDLTETASLNGWDATQMGRLAVYRWVYDNLWPSLENRVIGVVCTGPPNSGEIEEGGYNLFPLSLATRDYIVALRLPALWLSPVDEQQRALFSAFLEDSPSPIPVFGFVERYEEATVDLASEHGDWVAVLTNGNAPLSAGSLSCLSGIRVDVQQYEPVIDADDIFATLGEAPIVTFWSSDGDALQYVIDRGFYPQFTWDQLQGSDIGFTINPVLVDLAPLIWNYYVDSAEDTSLVCGYSGAGYAYPNLMDNDEFTAYLEHTATYMAESGLGVVRVDNRRGEFDIYHSQKYSSILGGADYIGNIVGATSLGYLGGGFSFLDVPEPSLSCTYTLFEGTGPWLRDKVAEITPGVISLAMAEYPWHDGDVAPDPDTASGEAVTFKATDGAGIKLWGPWAAMEPGDYEATYRMKVSDNSLNAAVADIFVGERLAFPDWRVVNSLRVRANTFPVAGEFVDFTFPFTLDDQSSWMEFRLEYLGNADLTLDTVTVRKLSEVYFPVYSGVIITPQEVAEPHATIQSIEEDGGHVLTPDEFMGSLNPRFMIDWATPVLGESHPSILLAKAQYEGGDYYQSLLTVRAALKALPERTYEIGFEDDGETHTARVEANTYVTDLRYDQDGNNLAFSTHGPPSGTVDMEAALLDGVGILRVVLDGEAQMEATGSDAPAVYGFGFPQGPHEIRVEFDFNQPPVAGFSYSPLEIAAGQEVHFSDESADQGSLDYSWSFGDGSTSSLPSPTHTYSEAGSYTVTLRVVDEYGLEDSASRELTVLRAPEFVYSNLQIQLETIRMNSDMTVSIDCENVGDFRGTDELDLIIDGEVVMTETVTLEPGETDTVEFTYTPTVGGTHEIEVDGFTDEFKVAGIPGFPPISILIGVALVLILLRTSRSTSSTSFNRTTSFDERV